MTAEVANVGNISWNSAAILVGRHGGNSDVRVPSSSKMHRVNVFRVYAHTCTTGCAHLVVTLPATLSHTAG